MPTRPDSPSKITIKPTPPPKGGGAARGGVFTPTGFVPNTKTQVRTQPNVKQVLGKSAAEIHAEAQAQIHRQQQVKLQQLAKQRDAAARAQVDVEARSHSYDARGALIQRKQPVQSPQEAQLRPVDPNAPKIGSQSYTPFFPGQKPSHYIANRAGSMPVYTYGSNIPLDTGGYNSPEQVAEYHRLRGENVNLGQEIIGGIAKTLPGVALARHFAGESGDNLKTAIEHEALNTGGWVGPAEAMAPLRAIKIISSGIRDGEGVVESFRSAQAAAAVLKAAKRENPIIARHLEHATARIEYKTALQEAGQHPGQIEAQLAVADNLALAHATREGVTPEVAYRRIYKDIQYSGAAPFTGIKAEDVAGMRKWADANPGTPEAATVRQVLVDAGYAKDTGSPPGALLTDPVLQQIAKAHGIVLPQLEPVMNHWRDVHPFFSTLGQAIQKMPEKFGVQELQGRMKSLGVKEEEIKWSGLNTFLDTLPEGQKSVSKEEVMAWLDSGYLRVEENVRRNPKDLAIKEDSPFGESNRHPQDDLTRFHGYTLPNPENYHELTIRLPEKEHGNLFQYDSHFPEPNVLAHMRFSDRNVEGKKSLFIEEIQSDWHQQAQKRGYQEPYENNEDYRNALAKHDDKTKDVSSILKSIRNHLYFGNIEDQGHGFDLSAHGSAYELQNDVTAYQLSLSAREDRQHYWFETKPIQDGYRNYAKVIIRDDRDPNWTAPATHELYADDAERKALMYNYFNKLPPADFRDFADKLTALRHAQTEQHASRTELNEVIRRLERGVPDAPFKKTWHELSFKRMLAWAVDHNYEHVSWTTGRQQAERYGLANFFDRVKIVRDDAHAIGGNDYTRRLDAAWDLHEPNYSQYTDWPTAPDPADFEGGANSEEFLKADLKYEGEYNDFMEKIDNEQYDDFVAQFDQQWEHDHPYGEQGFKVEVWKQGRGVNDYPDDTYFPHDAENLAEYVGPDIAQQAVDGQQVFEGDGLMVGDESKSAKGAIHFYDNKLTGFVNKYLKKFKVEVKKQPLDANKPAIAKVYTVVNEDGTPISQSFISHDNAIDEFDYWQVYRNTRGDEAADDGAPHPHLRGLRIETREEPVHGLEQAPSPGNVHGIDITPAVKDFVQGGQALFQEDDAERFHEWANDVIPKSEAMARDALRNLPEKDWPMWVHNSLVGQGLHPRQSELIDTSHQWWNTAKDTFPDDWLKQASQMKRIKGAVLRLPNGEHILRLFKGADASTIIHELGHALETMIPAGLREQLREAGLTDPESFARTWEAYFYKGKAPNAALEGPMREISAEMGRIYKGADAIPGAHYNEEIGKLFDQFFVREAAKDPAWARANAVAWFAQDSTDPQQPLLEAAGYQVQHGGTSVPDAAKMFGLDESKLQAHIDSGAQQAADDRIHSNADVGGGAAETTHTAEEILAAHDNPNASNDILMQMGEVHGFPEEKTQKNLAAKLNPARLDKGLPREEKVLNKNGHVMLGDVSPEEWVARLEHSTPDQAQREQDARFYEIFEPVFRHYFGPNSEKIMRAWSASQVNTSPSNGLASVLRALERIDRGAPVVGAEGGIGSVVADNIEKALKGIKLDSYIAAKISDFIDGLRGLETRTWMGHQAEGGFPVPGDIWAARDTGYLDKRMQATSGRYGNRVAKIEADHGVDLSQYPADNPGAPSGSRYERIAEKYHTYADHLNDIEYHGRKDWTPLQAQAMGWAGIQRFYGINPEDIEYAVKKAIEASDRQIRRDAIRRVAGPYEDLLKKFLERRGYTIGKKGMNQGERTYAEESLHNWADSNPDLPEAKSFLKLAEDAYAVKQPPEPELMFQTSGGTPPDITEAAQKLAEEHGVDINMIQGSGQDGKIVAKDIENASYDMLSPREKWLRGMKGVRSARGKQNKGYSQERSKRFSEVSAIYADENLTPLEKQEKVADALRSELPKIDYMGFKRLDGEAVNWLMNEVQTSLTLTPGQKYTISEAIRKAPDGRTPTPKEILILEHMFGKDVSQGFIDIAHHPLRQVLMDVFNIPRSIMASYDLSAPFRQALVAGARHPIMFAKNFGPMIDAAKNPESARLIDDSIRQDPLYPLAIQSGVKFTDLGGIATREESFPSVTAEKIPVVGAGVRFSSRAYTTFLNKMRMDMFKYHVRNAQLRGSYDLHDPQFLDGLGEFINTATGRGGGGEKFERAAPVLNTFLFSPRLLKARINMLNPRWYYRLDPYARKQALRSFISLGAEATAFVTAMSFVPGVKTVLDPRNPDWGKIKIGDTRFDIGGGFQQEIRLAAQIATLTAVSSTTGRKTSLAGGKFGQATALDQILRFFEGKESPIASIVTDRLRGTDQIGNKFDPWRETWTHLTPLIGQDAADMYHKPVYGINGLAAAAAGYAVESVGFGVQTYGPKDTVGPAQKKLEKQSKEAGLPAPPAEVLIAVDHKVHLDTISRAHPKDSFGRLKEVVQYYAKTNKDTSLNSTAATILRTKDKASADELYMEIRQAMIGDGLSQYEQAIKQSGVK